MNAGDLPIGVRGRLLAIALTILAATAIWVGVAAPLLDWYSARAERLAERTTLERRMRAAAASVPALLSEAGLRNDAGAAPALLDGATDAVAGARLQQTVQDLAARAGATVSSLETLPVEPAGPYRRIGLRVTLNAPWPVLVGLFQAAGQSAPPLLVDDLRLEGSHLVGPAAVKPLDALFTVIAFRATPPAASP